VETVKTADYDHMRLYGYRPKSVCDGLVCGLSCTPAPSVTTARVRRHMRHFTFNTKQAGAVQKVGKTKNGV